MSTLQRSADDVAVVAMAGRFPGAPSLEAFWSNLDAGIESIATFSDDELRACGVSEAELARSDYVRARGVLDGIEAFDAEFFGFSPKEAELTDPQQRLFLECVHEALEQAGIVPDTFGAPIALFAGAANSSYLPLLLAQPGYVDRFGMMKLLIANDKDHLATRVAFRLGLRGAAVGVQTTCSTSLVAVHLACRSVLSGESAVAIAGGVSISARQRVGYRYEEGGILSPDGHCRAFDARAAGTVDGSGAGVVVLRRLSDALASGDPVRAVIKGSAINNDGSLKVGYTAPSVDGQAAVVERALAVAGVDPATISYVEAHGTGTVLGDPAEIAGLVRAFGGRAQAGSCAIGSAKTNIGHLNTAAGIAGLIKTVLALEHAVIPASLNFERPNPDIDFACTPFVVAHERRPWPRTAAPRRAGVSAFGIGGTNAHVVVEEAPLLTRPADDGLAQVLTLAAPSPEALATMGDELLRHLEAQPSLSLADVAYTLNVGRAARPHRRIVVADTRERALETLRASPPTADRGRAAHPPRLVWLFAGQGTALAGSGRELYLYEPEFRATVDDCSRRLQARLRVFLPDVLYGAAASASAWLEREVCAQPALFVLEYALARLWQSWGVRPACVLGHSLGELVAACLAGVFSPEDALELVAARGALMAELPAGVMLAVACDERRITEWLRPPLTLAALNGPRDVVVGGPPEAIDELCKQLSAAGVAHRRLATRHAFHSQESGSIAARFAERVARVTLHAPHLPILSSATGTWLSPEECIEPSYWARQLVRPVRFADAVASLLRDPRPVTLEIGAGATLTALLRRHPQRDAADVALPSLPASGDGDSRTALLRTAGRLWLAGVPLDWAAVHAGRDRRRVALPGHPLERRRFWPSTPNVPAESAPDTTREPVASANGLPSLAPQIVQLWKEVLGIDSVGLDDNFFDAGGDSVLLLQVRARLDELVGQPLSIASLFENPTVRQLAAFLGVLLPERASMSEARARGARRLAAASELGARLEPDEAG